MENEPSQAADRVSRVSFFVAPRDGEEISVDIPVNVRVRDRELRDRCGTGNRRRARSVASATIPSRALHDLSAVGAGHRVEAIPPGFTLATGRTRSRCRSSPASICSLVQLADDEHRTIDGLCETITVSLLKKVSKRDSFSDSSVG